MMLSPAGALLLLSMLAAAPAGEATAPAPERLELASGERLSGRATGIEKGKLLFATSAGPRRVALGGLARLVRLPATSAARKTDGMLLASGDVLEGDAVDLAKGKLAFESRRFGKLTIDAASLRALFFNQDLGTAAGRLPGVPRAEVLMVTGSRTPAELRWLARDKLGLSSPLGALDVKKDDVAWVFTKAKRPARLPAGCCRVLLSTGESLTGKLASLSKDKLTLSWQGRELEVSWDLVRAVESPGVRMLYLSERKPSAEKSAAVLGPVRHPRADKCAAGGPLRLAGRTWARGVGMRARSRVSYSIGGKWKRFRALAGLDSAVAKASRGAVFRVLGDGRKLFEKQVKPGEAAFEVDVEVKGVKQLTLVLEPGPGFEIGDYGDWVDARLLR